MGNKYLSHCYSTVHAISKVDEKNQSLKLDQLIVKLSDKWW